jgi:BirA family biotin operon repressor/biotin-[acetyl-CoA-carboxylase] ligase
MFTAESLKSLLPVRGLGASLHYFETIGSTNDAAKELARADAVHGTLVVANEQTAGRGRGDKRWLTPRGSALALSLVMRPQPALEERVGIIGCMAALAVQEAVSLAGAQGEIKWPNDVLLNGRKVAGILVEAAWQGSNLASLVIGIGVNVKPGSVPTEEQLDYPAICVETVLAKSVERMLLVRGILDSLGRWWNCIESEELVQRINDLLAFRDQAVEIVGEKAPLRGILKQVNADGQLRLVTESGAVNVGAGGVHLHPLREETG